VPTSNVYLFSGLISLGLVCLILVAARTQRVMAIACGLYLALLSPLSLLHEVTYWNPTRLLGGGWGIEDVLFCFESGVLAWLGAAWPWASRLETRPVAGTIGRRWLACTAIAAALLAAAILAGMPAMPAFILVQTAFIAGLLVVRPEYWRLVVTGLTIFPLYYFAYLLLLIGGIPEFIQRWDGADLVGLRVFGLPLEEYLWVLSFTTSFPMAMAYLVDARFVSAAVRQPSTVSR
jgi:hypothetical protein